MIHVAKAAFVVLVLTSCNSFNTTTTVFAPTQVSTVVHTEDVAFKASGITEHTGVIVDGSGTTKDLRRDLCPRAEFPNPLPIPDLPFDELKKIGPNEQAKADVIMLKHIEDLRQTIKKTNSLISAAKASYSSRCKKYLEGK